MVPALCAWHEHHDRASREINLRLDRGEIMVIAAPSLVETYSALTRLPPPYRMTSHECLTLVEATFGEPREIVGLSPSAYLALLRSAPQERIVGGQIYDAVIAMCAREAQVDLLLTFNERHFAPFASWSVRIATPSLE
jgi:predicted nucleic acid-binding protein